MKTKFLKDRLQVFISKLRKPPSFCTEPEKTGKTKNESIGVKRGVLTLRHEQYVRKLNKLGWGEQVRPMILIAISFFYITDNIR